MKKSILLMTMVVLLAVSCKRDDEDRFTTSDSADVVSESIAEAYFNDIDDMSLIALEDGSSPSSGRMEENIDDRFCSAFIIEDGSTSTSGKITIDFGDGCEDTKLNTRTGKIILTYSNGPATTVGFTVVATFENYTINGIKLEGTRTITRLSSNYIAKHQIVLANGKATWPNNAQITRTSDFTRELLEGQTGLLISLDGSASGTNLRGKSYTMHIDETLLYDVNCATSLGIIMPVEGVKTFTSGGRQLTLDFGDGTCDSKLTAKVGNIPPQVIDVIGN